MNHWTQLTLTRRVPQTTGTLTVETESAAPFAMECTAGVSYSREAGAHHNIVNDRDEEFTFVQVESKAELGE